MADYQMPENWYWAVNGDTSRYWSSAKGAYVKTKPKDAGFTNILDEQELTEVLASYDLPGPLKTFPPLEPWKFSAMLGIADVTQAVDDAIAAIPDATTRAVAKAKREYALSFHRDDPLIEMLAPVVGLTTEQLDALWIQAAAL